ncbi:MAG TPA: alpha/beta hydrolase family protein [Chryseolinea sp.]|nr:alpha/beta hydrolase family protein [Chryseolinea sp.]
MNTKRRDFLKWSSMLGLTAASSSAFSFSEENLSLDSTGLTKNASAGDLPMSEENLSVIGQYGPWSSGLNEGKLPSHSFRKSEWSNLATWKEAARKKLLDRMAIPDVGATPKVTVKKQYTYDGLHIEELSWQLPYGRATDAILLKPANATGRLPAILGFHDHGGNKYFGTRKITKTSDQQHPLMVSHQQEYYNKRAWANEIAKRGYVVLVPDAFTFGTRRVMLQDVPEHMRNGLTDQDPENANNIKAYNAWAGEHEHVMSKSLFCAGTTWPSVFFAEDQKALDVLSARNDVDANNMGCAGLSGGGLRTVFMGGLDPRIKCAVCVGFMSTWKDFLLNKSFTHTWMTYVPIVPNELDFPEILGLRVPLPTMVLNDSEDQLYTLPEMKRADSILAEVFKKANAAGRDNTSTYIGPHKFDAQMQDEAFAWFDKWLKS